MTSVSHFGEHSSRTPNNIRELFLEATVPQTTATSRLLRLQGYGILAQKIKTDHGEEYESLLKKNFTTGL
ncbi:hypothetical protein CEXT_517901 [Caerostris extrusa]|uniref:Uncharacterized protein n=1 Tax=Caerostris extrusa TaxID=172846 RepID=A0AAV4SI07_CAEEX|nr:hypothetical protein CEXT_517901 [Caerostris extrusa]